MNSRYLATAFALTFFVACSTGNKATTTGSGGSSGSGSGGTTGASGNCTLAEINTVSGCACTNPDNSQCPNDYICDVDATKTCIFQCSVAADCTGTSAPDSVVSQCTGGLGCDCAIDPNTELTECITKVCGNDSDCGAGNVCTGGACGSAPMASAVTSCAVFPEYQVIEVGQSYTFTAQAYASGAPLHLGAATTFTWSAADSSVTAGTGGQFTGAAASTGADTASVKATINGISCTAQVLVVAAPATGSLRALVFDQLTGAALSGVTVIADSATSMPTDSTGSAVFTGITGSTHVVSAFLTGYGYTTIAGTTQTDVLIPLLRDATDLEGGVQGTMSNLFINSSNVHVGIAAMSIADGITNISFDLLLGASVPTMLSLGSSTYNVGLPSGVLIGLSNQTFKQNYSALGRSGYCDDPSTAGSKTLAGTCGTRSIWALGGDVPIDKLPIDQLSSGGLSASNLNLGPILTELLPVFQTFNSTLIRDQPITLGPVLPDGGGVNPSFLTSVNLNNGTAAGTGAAMGPAVPLTLKTTLKLPTLPKLGGTYVDGAIVLAGVNVPGRGLVPLGLTAGVDNMGTGTANTGQIIDSQATGMPMGQLTLDMAPSHGGAEGNPYKIGVLAASFTNLSGGLSASALITSPTACAAGSTSGLCYGGTIDLTSNTFPAFPEAAAFDYGTRIFTPPTNAATAGQSFYRVSFSDGNGNRWEVFTNGGFTLPAAPTGFQDRTRSDDATGSRSEFTVAAFYLPNSQTFDQTVTVSAANLGKADDLMTQFAIDDYSPPSIVIASPAAGSVTAGSAVSATISNDSSYSNQWIVCASTTATALTPTTSVSACTAGGTTANSSGNFAGTIPSTDVTGTAVSGGYAGYLHAVLTNSAGLPLVPPVEATVQVTVH